VSFTVLTRTVGILNKFARSDNLYSPDIDKLNEVNKSIEYKLI